MWEPICDLLYHFNGHVHVPCTIHTLPSLQLIHKPTANRIQHSSHLHKLRYALEHLILRSYLKDRKILTSYRVVLSIKLLWSRNKLPKALYCRLYYFKPLPSQTEGEAEASAGARRRGVSHQRPHARVILHGTAASLLMPLISRVEFSPLLFLNQHSAPYNVKLKLITSFCCKYTLTLFS